MGRVPEFTGGGLIRSAGGWRELKSLRKSGLSMNGDERILGDGDFVRSVLRLHQEQLEQRYQLAAEGYDLTRAAERVAEVLGVSHEELQGHGKQPERVAARSLL